MKQIIFRFFIIFVFANISNNGYTSTINDSIWEENFPIMQKMPKCKKEIEQMEKIPLSSEIVSQHLLQIKNTVEYGNGLKLKYNAIGQITYESNIYILYDKTDGYEYEVYMCVLSNKKTSYPLTLKIYYSIAGVCDIDFNIGENFIELSNYINNVEIPYVITEKYTISPMFSKVGKSKDVYEHYDLEIIP